MLQDYWTNWYQTHKPHMTVQFKPQTTIVLEVGPPPPAPPNYCTDDVSLKGILSDLKASVKQTDERGYFVQYYTASTNKPYQWCRYNTFYGVKPGEYGDYFNHAKQDLEKQKDKFDWHGIKLVAFSFDALNPMYGVNYMKEYCFELINPKKKTYINGVNANQEFLAKKGKMYTTKGSV